MKGLLLVDKERNMTSHDVVNILRKKLNIKRIGHVGTLDPFATGLLILLVGNDTKYAKYFVEHDKEYEVIIRVGCKTDTLDSTGNVVDFKKVEEELDTTTIDQILASFLGEYKQKPPMYSAKKVNGKKLYEYARKNQEVEVLERDTFIYSIKRTSYVTYHDNNAYFAFTVKCSKGLYIRVLCEDIGKKLGIPCLCEELRRTKISLFSLEHASTISDIIDNDFTLLEPLDFINMKEITFDDEIIFKVMNGVKLSKELFPAEDFFKVLDKLSRVVAIYRYDKEEDIMRLDTLI